MYLVLPIERFQTSWSLALVFASGGDKKVYLSPRPSHLVVGPSRNGTDHQCVHVFR
jgi:hypothetical protein